MAKKRKGKICGHEETQSGQPCYRRGVCPYHTEEKVAGRTKVAARSTKQTVAALRQEKMIELRLQGKTVAAAAREAGYSENTAKGKIYQMMDSREYNTAIKRHLEAANLDTAETIGILVSQMRGDIADFFPDDEFLQRAKQLGISQLIKKIKRRPIVAGLD